MSLQAADSFDSNSSNSLEEERVSLLSKKRNIVEVEVEVASVKGSSWFSSAFLVINAVLGAGLLNFPQAYDQAGGVAVAIGIQTIFMVFVVIAIFILSYSSDINGSATYQDVVLSVCGKSAQTASAFALLVYCYGTCITFLIIIADQWEEFFLFVARDTYCQESPIYMNRGFCVIVTSLIFILPLCFPRRIDFLKYASFIGVIGIVYVVGLVTAKYFVPHEPPELIKTAPDSWMDVFLVVPTICFAYQCHVSIIPIYSCMEKRNVKEFSKTVSVAMLMCVLTYTVTAALGYLQFGHAITSDILLSFEPDASVIVAVVFIAIKTYTTYPILIFCGRAAFETMYINVLRMTPEEAAQRENIRRIVTILLWFTTTVLLAVFIPNIGVVIQVLGALAAVFIFIFPGMCLLKTSLNELSSGTEHERRYTTLKAFACFFIVMGAFVFGLTLSQALYKDLQGGIKQDKSRYTC